MTEEESYEVFLKITSLICLTPMPFIWWFIFTTPPDGISTYEYFGLILFFIFATAYGLWGCWKTMGWFNTPKSCLKILLFLALVNIALVKMRNMSLAKKKQHEKDQVITLLRSNGISERLCLSLQSPS